MCEWVSLCIKPAENTAAYSSAAQYNSVLFGANNTAQSIATITRCKLAGCCINCIQLVSSVISTTSRNLLKGHIYTVVHGTSLLIVMSSDDVSIVLATRV